ncbi:MBL fold metallo-hydrolase [Arcobacter arenosus]|jgi:glyoxylase-like metal-dependent hydrolase (beta-lactamase superfamily II)|uniref:MBL fold metallo-hydrolase n=1 Tax=Arcobacter arenosus TaxID=2576037 RepID=A0A5R8XXZ0_9BACT|nr:MBL fold metallo-hydrolase [Arcobacter arenosus]TLP35760.1 MBL fold metallo-hydrolase [Arcobacter arenosus]
MGIKIQPMGDYQTNCYIISVDNKDFIIDPGVGATNWVKANVTNPIAILNTHGHFDHVWSNKQVSEELGLKIYTPKDDNFMLQKDPYGLGMTPSNADVLVEPDEEFDFDGVKVKFHHFPGHTPGCSAIEIDNNLFSGDFIFQNSIGRTDFPFSSPQSMKESIDKVLSWNRNIRIYPGHGSSTTLQAERPSLENWKNYL